MRRAGGGWVPDRRALVGVVHVEPLPGSPRGSLSFAEIEKLACADAAAWKEGGADAVIVENFGDTPFPRAAAPVETVAFLALIARSVIAETALPTGINILRNDALGALAAAAASGASFIRVNVLTHAFVTDQGIIEGVAFDLLRRRAALDADVAVWADVMVKHAAPLAPCDPAQAARDLAFRGGADAIIVTGEATGDAARRDDVRLVARAAAGVPLLVGSGVTPDNAPSFGDDPAGFIVGTWCKVDGRIDPERVGRIASCIHGEAG